MAVPAVQTTHEGVRTTQELADLERAYVWSVNSAVQTGTAERVAELAASYGEEIRRPVDHRKVAA